MGRILFIAKKILGGYGLLYNWWCTQIQPDGKSLAPVGWRVSTKVEWNNLMRFADPSGSGFGNIAGGKLKETGFDYWLDPNIDATNVFGFNGRGASRRDNSGGYSEFNTECTFWTNDTYSDIGSYIVQLGYYSAAMFCSYGGIDFYTHKVTGLSIRLIKDDPTGWIAGDTVTDADGNIYQTVKIGDQVWIASNWKCTKWNDGTPIDYVEANAAWVALTSAAWCNVNGDQNNK